MKKTTASLFYFTYLAAGACLSPFLVLHYQARGLSGSQIGILTGLTTLIAMAATPLLTGLADATRRHRLILTLSIAGMIVTILSLMFLNDFAPILVAMTLFAIVGAPAISLSDSAVMSMLGDERARYGRIRIWGTAGWGLVAPLAGWIIGRGGLNWSFWLFSGLMAFALISSLSFRHAEKHEGVSFLRGLRTLLLDRKWIAFLVMVFLIGLGMSTVNIYLFVHMEGLGSSKALMGIALTISTLSEAPVMFFGDRLLKRFKPRTLFIFVMLISGLRLVLYAVATQTWHVMLIQLLHGLTFPVLWVAGVAFAHENAPPGLHATAQGLFGVVQRGIAGAVGGLVGGILIGTIGPAGMYGAMGAISLGGAGLFLAGSAIARAKQTRRENKENAATDCTDYTDGKK